MALISSLPKIATITGVGCACVALGGGLADESGRLQSTLVLYGFVPTFVGGILVAFFGTIAWARQFDSGRRMRLAGMLFVAGLPMWVIGLNNVHGTTVLLILVAIGSWILSVVLVFMAFYARNSAL
jgi:hypothetical protein